MTLTRKHFKRLWFPSPDGDQCIPTRDAFPMSQKEFDQQMPQEFWAEVIQELSLKAPQTLLIAEAFWLTEHFFINEIGMHRVYNSGFMHHLRDEKNREYRDYLKSILQKEPAMLERFVNFLTTPDELPAILQFENQAKYLGVCRLMACLPGLPMFGHGQWEGRKEKYGMDIPRATIQEEADPLIVAEHNQLIRPLLQERSCFSTVENFRLYDFLRPDDSINEDIYAFSNSTQGQNYLVVFNNSDIPAQGMIQYSVPQKIDSNNSEAVSLPLWQNLKLPENNRVMLTEFSENNTHPKGMIMEIASGLPLRLGPYESQVYQVRVV